MNIEYYSTSHDQTQRVGEKLGVLISARTVIALHGDLGAGKTTFVQGLARGLAVPDNCYVTSPTYTIINEYPGRVPLFHMDLYRLDGMDDLAYLGFDEILSADAAVIVEWPEMLTAESVDFDLDITLQTDPHFNRKIIINASGLEGTNLLRKLTL